MGEDFGELRRRRLLSVVEEAGPESTGVSCPLCVTLRRRGFEVSVDVGGELRRNGPVREGEGEAVLDLAATEDEFGVEHARLDGCRRDVRAVGDRVDSELGDGCGSDNPAGLDRHPSQCQLLGLR